MIGFSRTRSEYRLERGQNLFKEERKKKIIAEQQEEAAKTKGYKGEKGTMDGRAGKTKGRRLKKSLLISAVRQNPSRFTFHDRAVFFLLLQQRNIIYNGKGDKCTGRENDCFNNKPRLAYFFSWLFFFF